MYQLQLNDTKNEEWDIIIKNGQLQLISDVEYISQKVKQLLLFIRGEWFRNITLGIPYFTQIFIKPVNIPRIRAVLKLTLSRNQNLKKLGVVDVQIENFKINPTKRSLSCDLLIKLNSGEIVKIEEGFTI